MGFIVFILIPIFVGLWAQSKINSAYNHWMRVPSRNNVSGYEAARAILKQSGINGVSIIEIPGHLTDHYDPNHKTLALSHQNYHGTTLAAIGVAAHEAGHAIQHHEGYAPLKLRSGLIPITLFASKLLPFIIFGGLIFPLMGSKLIPLAILIYLILTVFQFITLPVEFDASKRAKHKLQALGLIHPNEATGIYKTLDAAAYTYVAAFISSLGWLLYFIKTNSNK